MATADELTARIEALKAARGVGYARVTNRDGRTVEFKSVDEINKAIAAEQQELATLAGTRTLRRFHFVSAKGL